MMAASITVTGSRLAAATPAALFDASPVTGYGANKQEYVVSGDNRFLVLQPAETVNTVPITLILNWQHK